MVPKSGSASDNDRKGSQFLLLSGISFAGLLFPGPFCERGILFIIALAAWGCIAVGGKKGVKGRHGDADEKSGLLTHMHHEG